MPLRLPDKWLWDFWLAYDGPDIHVFYLQAPRSLPDPEMRHWHVSVGHAVSTNLRSWEVLPDALAPGPAGSWDDYTTWTGSVIEHSGLWYMFYTGSRRAENGLVQRIGLATSDNLLHWEKHPANPLIEVDPRWYELLDTDVWHDQAWRDPFVFRHAESDGFHAFITARSRTGAPDGRGVIGHARSENLIDWKVLPPLTEPGEYGHLEVPQMVEIEGQHYLLFCTVAGTHSAARLARTGLDGVTGTHYMVSDAPLGPYRELTDSFLVGDASGSLYAGKLVRTPAGEWAFMASLQYTDIGVFVGELSDPYPVAVDADGQLSVELGNG